MNGREREYLARIVDAVNKAEIERLVPELRKKWKGNLYFALLEMFAEGPPLTDYVEEMERISGIDTQSER